MHRLYNAPECHQTQTFGVCMNEVKSHMRRTKRRLLPLRRVQSTDARHVSCTHPLASVACFASYYLEWAPRAGWQIIADERNLLFLRIHLYRFPLPAICT